MHDLTLLIQLFGREVMDLLSDAGFETPRAIARAGPERLAAEGGIDLPLARRIVSAALEALAADEIAAGVSAADPGAADATTADGRAEAGVAAPGGPPAPRRAGKTERKARAETPERPARRPLKPGAGSLASTPAAGIGSRPDREAGGEGEVNEGRAPASPRAPAPEGEPLIDDAGVVSWMGFSSRTGMGRAMSFSVSDAILDSGAPAVAPAGDRQPAEEPKAAGRAAAGSSRVIDGSFWSFGQTPQGAAGAPTAGAEGGNLEKRMGRRATAGVAGLPAGHGVPRRRSHDEQ